MQSKGQWWGQRRNGIVMDGMGKQTRLGDQMGVGNKGLRVTKEMQRGTAQTEGHLRGHVEAYYSRRPLKYIHV